jgi:hypothetical protein
VGLAKQRAVESAATPTPCVFCWRNSRYLLSLSFQAEDVVSFAAWNSAGVGNVYAYKGFGIC